MKMGAFAVLRDGLGRVLFSHRRDVDLWNLPGGGVEEGETPWDAVVREVLEETGLQVCVHQLSGIYCRRTAGLAFVFLCNPLGGALRETEEADRNVWFHLDQVPPNTLGRHLERARDALASSPKVFMRVQTE